MNKLFKNSKIMKVTFVTTMIVLYVLLAHTNLTDIIRYKIDKALYPEKGLSYYYVFDETGNEWTGTVIILQEGLGWCRLWPADQPLEMSGTYWTYSESFNQWIYCEE